MKKKDEKYPLGDFVTAFIYVCLSILFPSLTNKIITQFKK